MTQALEFKKFGGFFVSMNDVVSNAGGDFPNFVRKFAKPLMSFCVLYNTLDHTPALAGDARELRFL